MTHLSIDAALAEERDTLSASFAEWHKILNEAGLNKVTDLEPDVVGLRLHIATPQHRYLPAWVFAHVKGELAVAQPTSDFRQWRQFLDLGGAENLHVVAHSSETLDQFLDAVASFDPASLDADGFVKVNR